MQEEPHRERTIVQLKGLLYGHSVATLPDSLKGPASFPADPHALSNGRKLHKLTD